MRSLALLLGLLLAGCLSNAPVDDATVADDLPVTAPELLMTVPPIDWDVAAAVDWWERFATTFVKRDAYLPANQDAREHLVAELERIGMDVEVRSYPASSRGVPLPGEAPLDMVAIVGTKQGTELPDRRIGLVSHFDTQTLTIQGAYDDASGVAAELALCEALSNVNLRRTLSCIFFDAEEQGLEASRAYVDDVVVEQDEGYVYDFVLGYDMTGINWPGHDWKMYVMTGGDEHVPLLGEFARDLMHGALGYPEDGVEVLDVHDRNSDERRFREAGVPIYRFAGGRHAADYPEYHMPGDTVEYVYGFVGGREAFEQGLATIVEGSYALATVLDATDLEGMRAAYG